MHWFRRIVVVLVPLLVLFFLYKLLFVWPAENQVREKQKAFLVAIEKAKYARCRRLLADDYSDQWEFGKAEVMLAIRDVRKSFLQLTLDWEEIEATVEGSTATLGGRIRPDGKGHAIAGMALDRMKRYEDQAFTFHWRKTSFWPWSWKIVRITHPELERPSGYTPGETSW